MPGIKEETCITKIESDKTSTLTSINKVDSELTTIPQDEQQHEKKFLDLISNEIMILLRNEEIELGSLSKTEIYLKKLQEKDYKLLCYVTTELISKCITDSDENRLAKLMYVLSGLDYNIIKSHLIIIARILSSQSDYFSSYVKEVFIQIFEIQDNKEIISILENLDFKIEWLDKYKLEVIKEVRGSHENLRKKNNIK